MELKDFLNRYKEEALQIDLAKEYPLVFDILEREKIKLHDADFISEIDEVIKFSEKAVKETKGDLRTAFLNEQYKATYVNGNAPFLSIMKCYYEYSELYNYAKEFKTTFENYTFNSQQEQNEINQYKKAYRKSYFEDVAKKRNSDGTENVLFRGNWSSNWLIKEDNDLANNKNLFYINEKLLVFNALLYHLANEIVHLYKVVNAFENTNNRGAITSIKISEDKIFLNLDSIQNYSEIVKSYIEKNEIENAIKLKNYCLRTIEGCFKRLKDVLMIDIYSSPLKTKFENLIHVFDKTINTGELNLLQNDKFDKVPQQTENKEPNESLLKNQDIKIFKNDFAYTLFNKMKECYNDSNTKQADYSNLFDIMQKDKSVICSGVDFITLLSKYDIYITKIDSSKTGNKKKTILYNSIKEDLQKKHGLSTV